MGEIPLVTIDDHPDWAALYHEAWRIAMTRTKSPRPGSGLVSVFMDEAFSDNIFQWDTCFMVLFGRLGNGTVPAVKSLDNFYALQRKDGYICREISEIDGHDIWPKDSAVAINPPLFSWAEWKSYEVTGDKQRLKKVLRNLIDYYVWIKKNRRVKNGLYYTSGLGSGMDNSPRCYRLGYDDKLDYGYTWVDMSSQQALNALYISKIAGEVGDASNAKRFKTEYESLSKLINKLLWSEKAGFYYDLTEKGEFTGVKTIASFWPLLAGVADKRQAEKLVEHLKKKSEFNRPHPVPTLAKSSPFYDVMGGYWRGAVWAPTEYMVVRGLDEYGYGDLAREIAAKHLNNMSQVYKTTGTIWENYAPESPMQGKPAAPEFVGWSGLGPIAMLIEDIIGIRADAARNLIYWRVKETGRHGVHYFKFGGHTVSLLADPRKSPDESPMLHVTTDSTIKFLVEVGKCREQYTLTEGVYNIKACDIPN